MCGRYASSRRSYDLSDTFDVVDDEVAAASETANGEGADYNVAPTKKAPVVLERVRRGERDGSAQADAPDPGPTRQLRLLSWGLVPSWAKDPKVGSRMINARSEKVFETASYRRAVRVRRAIVPADGWYEWQKSPTAVDDKGRARKQPFYMSRRDGEPIAFAGLYEFWRNPEADDGEDAWLATYTILTTTAEKGLDRVHDRMPVVLERDRWDAWLSPSLTEPEDVRPLIEPVAAGRFIAVPVSTAVNNVRNNGPELREPISVEESLGVVDPVTGEVLG